MKGIHILKKHKLFLFAKEGIPYIATHPDYKCITEFGSVPDLGGVSEMIYLATGKRPVVAGKPQPLIPELAMKKCGVTREETVLWATKWIPMSPAASMPVLPRCWS